MYHFHLIVLSVAHRRIQSTFEKYNFFPLFFFKLRKS